jgi:hypothetical protein
VQPQKPYLEAFFIGMHEPNNMGVYPISQAVYHALENVAAEVNIPFKDETADYCMVVMILNLEANQPAIMEMMTISAGAAALVNEFRSLFKAPSIGDES